MHIHNIATLIYRVSDQAQVCNKEIQLGYGYALSDFARSVLEVGKRYAFLVAEGFDVCFFAAQEGGGILASGIGKGLEASTQNLKEFLDKATTNPVEVVTDFVDCMTCASIALGRLFCYMLEAPDFEHKSDITREILAFDERLHSMSNREKAIGVVAFGTELLCSIGLFEFAGLQLAPVARIVKEFSTIAYGELALASHAVAKGHTALKLTAPITEMFGDGLLMAKITIEDGKDTVRKAIDMVKRNQAGKVNKLAVVAENEKVTTFRFLGSK
jgi:hypothetical protein